MSRLVVLAVLTGLSLVPVAAAAQQAPPPAVVVTPAVMTELADSITLNGRLDADNKVDVRARIVGTLQQIGFQPGDTVAEGAELFRIDPAVYEAAVRGAEGSVRSAKATRDLAALERDRQKQLVDRKVGTQAQYDQAVASLERAEGELLRLEAALTRAELDLSYTRITAPFAGRVGKATVAEGALVSPETGPLVTITNLDPIHAEFSISTALLRTMQERVAAGTASGKAAVGLVLANGSPYDRPGEIVFIDARVSAGTDTVLLRARFDNPDGKLLDGELVRVVLTQADSRQVLAVPQQAVQRDLQGDFVMVVDGENKATLKRIKVDRNVKGLAVVSEGLSEGDQVITEGVNKVRPGITVDAALAGNG